ncbi:hypothetical protein [Roseibium sp. RKSG952]|uniref:hypothetical protein n=1 Tax=Roseibium sp. RKSG952 TaxID=2529384 RepID=UPI0012BC73E3|nr:hypothetical protein [Roseibium sp. RKSG952]MTH95902.1 hypothetical protein [Roseibium sp. RKSG952]
MDSRHEYFSLLKGIAEALSEFSEPLAKSAFERLSVLFMLMEIRASGGRSMNIDHKNSGFPVAADVLAIGNDVVEGVAMTGDRPDDVRKEILDEILLRRRLPNERMRERLARGLYAREMNRVKSSEAAVFCSNSEEQVFFKSLDGGDRYEFKWDAWDSSLGRAIHCRADIKTDGKLDGEALEKTLRKVKNVASKFASSGFKMITLAQEIADSSDHIYVNLVERVVIGPLLNPSFSSVDDPVRDAFESVSNQRDAWVIRWIHETAEAGSTKEVRAGIFSSRTSQNFRVDTSDPDCAERGATEVVQHIAMPHAVYQQISTRRNECPSLKGASVHVVTKTGLIEYN